MIPDPVPRIVPQEIKGGQTHLLDSSCGSFQKAHLFDTIGPVGFQEKTGKRWIAQSAAAKGHLRKRQQLPRKSGCFWFIIL